MKKYILFFISLSFSFSLCSQTWDWKAEWTQDSIESQWGYGKRCMEHLPGGNYYIVENLFYAWDSTDSYIIAFSPSGDSLWKKYYPFEITQLRVHPSGDLFAHAVFRDSMNVNGTWVSPEWYTDELMIHLDANGNYLNVRNFDGIYSIGGFCFRGDSIVVCGTYRGDVNIDGQFLPDNGDKNSVLLSTDLSFNAYASFTTDCTNCYSGEIEAAPDGHLVWFTTMSGMFYFTDSSMWGNSGTVLLKSDPDLSPQKQVSYGYLYSVGFDLLGFVHGNNLMMQRTVDYTSSGEGNGVQKLDNDLNLVWEVLNYGGYPMGYMNSIMGVDMDENDNVYFAGYYMPYMGPPETTTYVGKLDEWGVLQWLHVDSVHGTRPQLIAVNYEDDLLIAGIHDDSSHVGPLQFTDTSDFIAHYGYAGAGILEQEDGIVFNVFPNPGKEIYAIETGQKGNIVVYTLRGERILERGMMEGRNYIDLHAAPGIYLLEFNSEKGTCRRKICQIE
jgi:hypothetical protein